LIELGAVAAMHSPISKELTATRHPDRPNSKGLNWYTDEDGMLVFKGRFSPEQGILIRQSLEKAMTALFQEQIREHPDVSAETCC